MIEWKLYFYLNHTAFNLFSCRISYIKILLSAWWASACTCSALQEMENRLLAFSSLSTGLLTDLEMNEQHYNKVYLIFLMFLTANLRVLHSLCFVLASFCGGFQYRFILGPFSPDYRQHPFHPAVSERRTAARNHAQRKGPDDFQVCIKSNSVFSYHEVTNPPEDQHFRGCFSGAVGG